MDESSADCGEHCKKKGGVLLCFVLLGLLSFGWRWPIFQCYILHIKTDSPYVSGMFAFEKFFSSHGPSLRRKTGHIKFSRKVDGGNLVKLHFLSIFNGVITSYKSSIWKDVLFIAINLSNIFHLLLTSPCCSMAQGGETIINFLFISCQHHSQVAILCPFSSLTKVFFIGFC